MKKMYQFRFYGNSTKNYPQGLSVSSMKDGELFRSKGAITHLGIQAAPGTTFFLNNGLNPIQVGKTGIYEINISGYGYITSLSFSEETLASVNEDNGIIIDILYEGGSV